MGGNRRAHHPGTQYGGLGKRSPHADRVLYGGDRREFSAAGRGHAIVRKGEAMKSRQGIGSRACLAVCAIVWSGACSSGNSAGTGGAASGGKGGSAGMTAAGGVGATGGAAGYGGAGGLPAAGGFAGGVAGVNGQGGGGGGGAAGGGGGGAAGGIGGAAGGRGGAGAAGGAGGQVSANCAEAPPLSAIVGGNSCPSAFEALPASPSAVDLWIDDVTATGGGYRLLLNSGMAMSAGGHSYSFGSGDTLFGTGSSDGVGLAVTGMLALSVDGHDHQITFDLGGCGRQGMPPTSLAARVTITRAGIAQTVMRSYAVTSPGVGTPYAFTRADGPDGCRTGVDLMGITF
jgi:hypothetical protein